MPHDYIAEDNAIRVIDVFIDELDLSGLGFEVEPQKLERLCRHISRPAVSEKRLSLTPNGNIRYQLKTPYRDGTTHVIFEPLDFIPRLAALVPKPRVNLTRFHGVFARNSHYRAVVTPAKRGKGNKAKTNDETQVGLAVLWLLAWWMSENCGSIGSINPLFARTPAH